MEKPLIAQYRRIKAEHEDCILFFRLGSFFCVFFEDSFVVASVLNLSVIARSIGDGGKSPACGVPAGAVEHHAGVLSEKGYKVAICDQVDGADEGTGLRNRAVIRVFNPDNGVKAPPVDPDEYTAFLKAFEENAAKKQRQTGKDEQIIVHELEALDLMSVSAQEAWGILYHWKMTYCEGK